MKKVKKILSMALAFSLAITQIPAGKAAKAAGSEAVELHYGQKAVIVEEQTAKIDIDALEVNLSCNPDGIEKTDGSGQEWVAFNPYMSIDFDVTVAGVTKTINQKGTDDTFSKKELTFSLDGLGIKKGDSFKIEATTYAYDSVGDTPWLFKVAIAVPTAETTVSDAVELHYGQKAVVLEEQTAKVDINALEVNLSCNPDGIEKTDGSGQEWVAFNPYMSIDFDVTVAGVKKTINVPGTDDTFSKKELTFSLDGLGIKKGDSFKIEATTYAYDSVGSDPWLFKLSCVVPTSSDDPETPTDAPTGAPPTDTPSDSPSTPPTDTPSDSPSTPPTDTPSELVEVQTSAWAANKKLATIIPETTADTNYNTAAVTVQCASDVSFNEHCKLNLVVTVNGKAITHTQEGASWESGATSTYEIKNEFEIKAGDTYKVEAYTDSWEAHTSSYVYKVSATLGYEASDVNIEQGKLYCGKKVDVLATSDATADCNSMTFEVRCAADTSFNPWTSIEFIVIINSTAYTYTVKGTDESYSMGSVQSCTIDGLGIKARDCVRIQAITYSWDSASDYVFKVTAKDSEGSFTPSDNEMEALPIIEPSKTTPKPEETPSAEPTAEPTETPGTEPTDEPTAEPTTEPTVEPTETPSAKPTAAPLKEGDKRKEQGTTYQVVDTEAKTVTYIATAKKTTVLIPNTVKLNGKTYKVVAIANGAFKNDKKLQKITIGSNIKTIGKNAFKGCTNMKKIVIKSKKQVTIGKDALKGLPKQTVIEISKANTKLPAALKKAGFKGTIKKK